MHGTISRNLRSWKDGENNGIYEVVTQVDWEANEQAITGLPVLQMHWLTKQVSGMCGGGKMVKIWGEQEADKCLRCRERRQWNIFCLARSLWLLSNFGILWSA